jgi:hypothetical protein
MQEKLVTPLVSRGRKERSWKESHFTRFMPLSMENYSLSHASVFDSTI